MGVCSMTFMQICSLFLLAIPPKKITAKCKQIFAEFLVKVVPLSNFVFLIGLTQFFSRRAYAKETIDS
jgi:hypothetical protein